MTILEHIYALKEILSSNQPTDDFPYSEEFLYHLLKAARARLIESRIDSASPFSYTTHCIDLEPHSLQDCCSTCTLYRSTVPIPDIISDQFKVLSTSGKEISQIPPSLRFYLDHLPIPPRFAYFVLDKHIFSVSTTPVTKLIISAIFEDPAEVASLSCIPDSSCEPFQADFNFDAAQSEQLYSLCIRLLREGTQVIPKDNLHNSNAVT